MRQVCQLMIFFLHFILLCHIILSKKCLRLEFSGLSKGKVCRSSPETKETRSILLNIKIDINFGRVKMCVKL